MYYVNESGDLLVQIKIFRTIYKIIKVEGFEFDGEDVNGNILNKDDFSPIGKTVWKKRGKL